MDTGFARGGTLDMVKTAITIADPCQPDTPVIYANQAFERLTDYPLHMIVGRNCRFLQGDQTNRHTVHKIHQALQDEHDIDICLTNYTRTGLRFENLLMLAHLKTPGGRKLILGCQYSIDDSVLDLDLHVRTVDGVRTWVSGTPHPHHAQSLAALRMRSQSMRMLMERYLAEDDVPDVSGKAPRKS